MYCFNIKYILICLLVIIGLLLYNKLNNKINNNHKIVKEQFIVNDAFESNGDGEGNKSSGYIGENGVLQLLPHCNDIDPSSDTLKKFPNCCDDESYNKNKCNRLFPEYVVYKKDENRRFVNNPEYRNDDDYTYNPLFPYSRKEKGTLGGGKLLFNLLDKFGIPFCPDNFTGDQSKCPHIKDIPKLSSTPIRGPCEYYNVKKLKDRIAGKRFKEEDLCTDRFYNIEEAARTQGVREDYIKDYIRNPPLSEHGGPETRIITEKDFLWARKLHYTQRHAINAVDTNRGNIIGDIGWKTFKTDGSYKYVHWKDSDCVDNECPNPTILSNNTTIIKNYMKNLAMGKNRSKSQPCSISNPKNCVPIGVNRWQKIGKCPNDPEKDLYSYIDVQTKNSSLNEYIPDALENGLTEGVLKDLYSLNPIRLTEKIIRVIDSNNVCVNTKNLEPGGGGKDVNYIDYIGDKFK